MSPDDPEESKEPTGERIEVGDNERTRFERDELGLKIDPETGRAYEDQGDFHNLGLSAGGQFYNGKAVPRSVQCAGCGGTVIEAQWGQGFQNCGAFDVGLPTGFFLCRECVARVLKLFPRIAGIVAALTGGKLRA